MFTIVTIASIMKLQELFESIERSILSVMGKQPEHVDGDFDCRQNKLTSLEGVPSSIGGDFIGARNNLASLHNIHKQIKYIGGGIASFPSNPIKSHVLGLLLIDGLKKVYLDNLKISDIINKHLEGDRDIFACQEELIENGFDEYAQL